MISMHRSACQQNIRRCRVSPFPREMDERLLFCWSKRQASVGNEVSMIYVFNTLVWPGVAPRVGGWNHFPIAAAVLSISAVSAVHCMCMHDQLCVTWNGVWSLAHTSCFHKAQIMVLHTSSFSQETQTVISPNATLHHWHRYQPLEWLPSWHSTV